MRSFLEPVIHRPYKHNLLHALGGRAALFLQLKTFDVQPKRDRKGKNCISMGCTFPAEVSEDVIPATFGPSERAKVAVYCSDALHGRSCEHRTDELALRLYSTWTFKSINGPLRDLERTSAHPLSATVGSTAHCTAPAFST